MVFLTPGKPVLDMSEALCITSGDSHVCREMNQETRLTRYSHDPL